MPNKKAAAPAPWDKKNPKKEPSSHLSEGEKKKAKSSAEKAGRNYPNLVDNMKVMKQRKEKKA